MIVIRVVRFLKKEISPRPKYYDSTDQNDLKKIQAMIRVLYKMPIVTIILWIVATINRGYEIFIYFYGASDTIYSVWLATFTLQAILMSSRGCIYAIMYLRYQPISNGFTELKNKICCVKACSAKDFTEMSENLNSL